MQYPSTRSASGPILLAVAALAALVTWLCVGWFAGQPALTAMMAVLLVELCLASVGMIVILITERMTVILLDAEQEGHADRKPRLKPTPLWHRVPDTPPIAMTQPGPRSVEDQMTLAFPTVEVDSEPDASGWVGRAA